MGHSYANEFANFTGLNAYQALVVVAFFVFLLWKGVLFGYLLFSVFDFWFQKHEGLKKMKMSKDEVKREAKDTDGNPEIKGSAVAFIPRYKVEVWLITSKINRYC